MHRHTDLGIGRTFKPMCPLFCHVIHGLDAGTLQASIAQFFYIDSVSVKEHTTVSFSVRLGVSFLHK